MSNSFRDRRATRLVVFVAIPVCVLVVAVGAAWLKWQVAESHSGLAASAEAVRAATEGAVALLSYQPDTVDEEMVAARERLTGEFREAFASLTDGVVIPGAKEKQISSTASVTAAASVSANEHHAEVLLFVKQTTAVGDGPPTQSASSVTVKLSNIDGTWLISDFAPTRP